MRINSHERYGNGPRLSTKQDRMFIVYVVILALTAGGMLVRLVWN